MGLNLTRCTTDNTLSCRAHAENSYDGVLFTPDVFRKCLGQPAIFSMLSRFNLRAQTKLFEHTSSASSSPAKALPSAEHGVVQTFQFEFSLLLSGLRIDIK